MGGEANGLVVRGTARPGAVDETADKRHGGYWDKTPRSREAEDVIRDLIAEQNRRIYGGGEEMTETAEFKCEFCGRVCATAKGLGRHRWCCEKNPNRKTFALKPSDTLRVERARERAVEANVSIADLKRRLIDALRAERDRLDRELAVLAGEE